MFLRTHALKKKYCFYDQIKWNHGFECFRSFSSISFRHTICSNSIFQLFRFVQRNYISFGFALFWIWFADIDLLTMFMRSWCSVSLNILQTKDTIAMSKCSCCHKWKQPQLDLTNLAIDKILEQKIVQFKRITNTNAKNHSICIRERWKFRCICSWKKKKNLFQSHMLRSQGKH